MQEIVYIVDTSSYLTGEHLYKLKRREMKESNRVHFYYTYQHLLAYLLTTSAVICKQLRAIVSPSPCRVTKDKETVSLAATHYFVEQSHAATAVNVIGQV